MALLFVALVVIALVAVFGVVPTVSARITPTGWKMPDGYQTTLAFRVNPAIQFWEIEVQPSGWQGGDPIDTTTMLNLVYKTKDAQHLRENTPINFTAAYDPDVWSGIRELINNPNSITIHYPDGSTLAFYGYLKEFMPPSHKTGEMPVSTGQIIVTNWDPVNFVEQGPVFTPASGT